MSIFTLSLAFKNVREVGGCRLMYEFSCNSSDGSQLGTLLAIAGAIL